MSSAAQRSSERISASLAVSVQLCDPETKKPISRAMSAATVDVSEGGLRLHINNVSGTPLEHTLAPHVALVLTVDSVGFKPREAIVISVSSFRLRTNENGVQSAQLGGYFTHIHPDDRAALLRKAYEQSRSMAAAAAAGREPASLWKTVVLVLAVVLLLGWGLALRTEVADLRQDLTTANQTLVQLRLSADITKERLRKVLATTQLETQPRSPISLKTEAKAQPAVAVAGAATIKPAAVLAALPTPASLTNSAGGLSKVDFRIDPRGLDNVVVESLEMFQRDFLGALTSKAISTQIVSVSVAYNCETSNEAPCTCDAKNVTLPPNKTVEFACTMPALPRADKQVSVLIGPK